MQSLINSEFSFFHFAFIYFVFHVTGYELFMETFSVYCWISH